MRKNLLFLTLSFVSFMGFSQTEIGEICKWDGNKNAAVVLTFDDWLTTHPTIVVPALQERNMIGTFYVVTKDLATTSKVAQMKTAAEYGNEIGNHTVTHPQSYASIISEIRTAKEALEEKLEGVPIETFDYPYGTIAETSTDTTYTQARMIDSVRVAGHIAARGVWNQTNFYYTFAKNDDAYYNITTIVMSNSVDLETFASYVTKTIQRGGMVTYLYHGVAKSGDYANIPKADFLAQLDTLHSLQDKIWVTSLARAVKYHKEKNCATLTLENETKDGLEVLLSDTLADSVYNQQLTLKINTNGKSIGEISQKGIDCPIIGQTSEYVLFRAIPDAGTITLKYGEWEELDVEDIEVTSSISVKNKTIFVAADDDVEVKIFTISGNLLAQWYGSDSYITKEKGYYIVTLDNKSQIIVIQ